MLARALADSGYEVSIVTFDYGQPNGVEIDGVRIYKACAMGEGFPVVRFLHPRLTSLWRAMKQAKADVYYQRACGMLTGVVAHYCRLHDAKMLYAAASDVDFDPELPLIRYGRDRALYRYGLRHCHAVVAQNADQLAACKLLFGRDATLIKSCYLAPDEASSNPEGYILWVSTIRRLKQPEVFLELARILPQYRFKMVGGPGAKVEERNLFESVKAQSSELPNLEIVGFVPYAEINSHFDQARILVNTSEFEGFPNTFLQAWARGMPTVSFLKGKTTKAGHGPDWSVDSIQDMAEAICRLMDSPDHLRRQGEICRQYYLANHSQDVVVRQYRELISTIAQAGSRGNAA